MSERADQYLDELEAEGVYILREAVAQAKRPVLLFSIGKDSCTLLHVARKAFHPGPLPFPVLHVDTRWEFREMIAFRDSEAKRLGFHLVVHTNPDGLRDGINPVDHGTAHTEVMRTLALRQALAAGGHDCVFGDARRDAEASPQSGGIFSHRNRDHEPEPGRQGPELWRLYDARASAGQTLHVHPLSNWTELDVWRYVRRERIPVVDLYFARPRPTVVRDGALIVVDDERLPLMPGEEPRERLVRLRTLSCYPSSGAVESDAASVDDIIAEIEASSGFEHPGQKAGERSPNRSAGMG